MMINSYFVKNKFKIILATGLALIITLLLSQAIFWRNTTLINPAFPLKVQALLRKVVGAPANLLALLKSRTSQEETGLEPIDVNALPTMTPNNTVDPSLIAHSTDFETIGAGISAGIDQNTGNKYVKIEAGTVVEVTEYTLTDGRRIKVIKPLD